MSNMPIYWISAYVLMTAAYLIMWNNCKKLQRELESQELLAFRLQRENSQLRGDMIQMRLAAEIKGELERRERARKD